MASRVEIFPAQGDQQGLAPEAVLWADREFTRPLAAALALNGISVVLYPHGYSPDHQRYSAMHVGNLGRQPSAVVIFGSPEQYPVFVNGLPEGTQFVVLNALDERSEVDFRGMPGEELNFYAAETAAHIRDAISREPIAG